MVDSSWYALDRSDLGDGTELDDRAFNVGTQKETSVNQLAATLMQAAGREVAVEHASARAGELAWNSLACDKLRGLGWAPAADLSEGLARTFRWIAGKGR
jgi:UDP-glucose 4-epimerase